MQRSFIVSKESEYFKDYQNYKQIANKRKEFVNHFFKNNNIEATKFCIRGNGLVQKPFDEDSKSDIALSIIPTENDLNKFGKMFKKLNKHGLYEFRKNSKIAKDFAQKCIDEKIVINLWQPTIRDYFKSIELYACSSQQFIHKNIMYLSAESDFLKEDDTPEGFKEIKLSEFYSKMEEFRSEK